ncbi:uncharacterized protein MELLADRAFT_95020 [Melampsora larici-populina 98AG31]|uniref:Uncharacterized protein n=1 Tax=Melampsora larici-populina (strain 98AG31 / pathotype 3-4-7) TaxID=747676 RepID=F4S8U5_MELLP|nr:uncharacterized protein MELLADRAFT_95020 [Melampsora larici-populina 98AG31]EGF98960.1 hypothetical protein MELLADRAFT_95020 [Melampsora larici-populina 98AG31]
MDLPDLSKDKIETKPTTKTTKQKRAKSIPAPPTQTQPAPSTSTSQIPSQYPVRFQALFEDMKSLDESIQNDLLDRFFRDCEVAKAAKSLKKEVVPPQLEPSPESSPMRQTDHIETEHANKPTSQEEEIEEEQDPDMEDDDNDDIPPNLLMIQNKSTKNTTTSKTPISREVSIPRRATRSENIDSSIRTTRKTSCGNSQASDVNENNTKTPSVSLVDLKNKLVNYNLNSPGYLLPFNQNEPKSKRFKKTSGKRTKSITKTAGTHEGNKEDDEITKSPEEIVLQPPMYPPRASVLLPQ